MRIYPDRVIRLMIEFLRRHQLLTLSVSVPMVLIGAGFLFLSDPEDLSDRSMWLSLGSFVAFCVGLVGIISLFRPISFSKTDSARWELVRIHKKWNFVGRFILGAIPVLAGVFISMGPDLTVSSFVILSVVIFGLAALVGVRFWKHSERQYASQAVSSKTDGPRSSENKQLYEQRSEIPDREIRPNELSFANRERPNDR